VCLDGSTNWRPLARSQVKISTVEAQRRVDWQRHPTQARLARPGRASNRNTRGPCAPVDCPPCHANGWWCPGVPVRAAMARRCRPSCRPHATSRARGRPWRRLSPPGSMECYHHLAQQSQPSRASSLQDPREVIMADRGEGPPTLTGHASLVSNSPVAVPMSSTLWPARPPSDTRLLPREPFPPLPYPNCTCKSSFVLPYSFPTPYLVTFQTHLPLYSARSWLAPPCRGNSPRPHSRPQLAVAPTRIAPALYWKWESHRSDTSPGLRNYSHRRISDAPTGLDSTRLTAFDLVTGSPTLLNLLGFSPPSQ